MTKNKGIPDSYFEEEGFLLDEMIDESKILGVLGPNPSPEQIFKYELCRLVGSFIAAKGYSNTEAGKITGLDASDISRISNFHLDRFTIDRLIKIYSILEDPKNVWKTMTKITESIEKRIA
jgi:hypothetical protein